MLFFYNSKTRTAGTATVNFNGDYTHKKDLTSAGFGEWTHIVSDGRTLLFYNAITKKAVTGKLESDGSFTSLRDLSSAGFGEWTHIVSDAQGLSGPVRVNGDLFSSPTVESLNVKGFQANFDLCDTLITTAQNFRASGNPANPSEPAIRVASGFDIVLGDCAEDFDTDEDAHELLTPGTVAVFSEEGRVRHSTTAYDKCVAGVVSGAGNHNPAIVLDRRGDDDSARVSLSLMGKVQCNVDARDMPVETGDMLTTSDTPGHAMKATDPTRAFGAVVGKALHSITGRLGHIPILVTLQ
ncbi:hypothetical protein GCM10011581_43290 [Saccharopolyspora subtropica]|uniref:Uncharacterized protein n=1 Tax=Saccharopolyspora thermophila TaxID=89367 RepID=A0A917K568_9PSEU|nr:hypothetical protein [Saccharopolyspora subtropica]GGJ01434.1 hypothetical protein GCM10011581_43290 [Saccharopolyspora subtropica]